MAMQREGEREPQPNRKPAHAALPAEPVAHAAHRLDRPAPERPVDLLSEVAHVDVDDVRAVLVRVVPRVLDQLVAREHLPRAPHERLEQRELLGGELDLGVPAPDLPRCRVEPEVADLEHRRALAAPRRASARSRARSSANENGFGR